MAKRPAPRRVARKGLITFGLAGPMKVSHAVAMHAIQVRAALTWLLGVAVMGERRRLGLCWRATVGMWRRWSACCRPPPAWRRWTWSWPAAALSPLGIVLLGTAVTAALLALRQPTAAST